MNEIPTHYYKNQWYKDIGFNIEPLDDVFNNVGEKLFKPHQLDFHQFLFITDGKGQHEVDFNTINLEENTIIPLVIGQVQSYVKYQNLKGFVVVFTSDFILQNEINLRYLFNYSIFNTIVKPFDFKCDNDVIQLVQLLFETFVNNHGFAREELMRNY